MGKYFTAYRIDHVLGFFRIWELPDHAMTGLVGKFRPSIPLSQVAKSYLHNYIPFGLLDNSKGLIFLTFSFSSDLVFLAQDISGLLLYWAQIIDIPLSTVLLFT